MTGKDKKLSLLTTIGRSDVFMEVPITNIDLKQCVSDHMVSIYPYHSIKIQIQIGVHHF